MLGILILYSNRVKRLACQLMLQAFWAIEEETVQGRRPKGS